MEVDSIYWGVWDMLVFFFFDLYDSITLLLINAIWINMQLA